MTGRVASSQDVHTIGLEEASMRIRARIAPRVSLVGLLAIAGTALLGCDPANPTDPAPEAAAFGKTPPATTAEFEVLPVGSSLWVQPANITDSGIIVGRGAYEVSPKLLYHAVRWTRPDASASWQIEDLNERLPSPEMSQADKVNEDGLIIGYMEIGGVGRSFVLPASGPAIDLGPSTYAQDLSPSGELTGSLPGSGGAVPAYWAGPGAVAELLPSLEPGQSAQTLFFAPGGVIVGVGRDAAGQWLVQWTRGASGWSIQRLQPSVPKGPLPHAVNALGQAIGYGCPSPTPCDLFRDRRPYYWSNLRNPPIALPILESRSSTYVIDIGDNGLMAGYDNVRGSTTSRPLAWPSPQSIVPLLPKGVAGTAGGVNGLGQIVGTTSSGAVVWTLP